jgi:hypothetical protein
MSTTWISVPLTVEEKEALHTLADMEYRNSRNQAALIIRSELIHLGLLHPDPTLVNPEQIETVQASNDNSSR